jgi:hypothetical protein
MRAVLPFCAVPDAQSSVKSEGAKEIHPFATRLRLFKLSGGFRITGYYRRLLGIACGCNIFTSVSK